MVLSNALTSSSLGDHTAGSCEAMCWAFCLMSWVSLACLLVCVAGSSLVTFCLPLRDLALPFALSFALAFVEWLCGGWSVTEGSERGSGAEEDEAECADEDKLTIFEC